MSNPIELGSQPPKLVTTSGIGITVTPPTVEQLEAQVTALQASLTALQAQVATMERSVGSIASLSAAVETLSSQFTGHTHNLNPSITTQNVPTAQWVGPNPLDDDPFGSTLPGSWQAADSSAPVVALAWTQAPGTSTAPAPTPVLNTSGPVAAGIGF